MSDENDKSKCMDVDWGKIKNYLERLPWWYILSLIVLIIGILGIISLPILGAFYDNIGELLEVPSKTSSTSEEKDKIDTETTRFKWHGVVLVPLIFIFAGIVLIVIFRFQIKKKKDILNNFFKDCIYYRKYGSEDEDYTANFIDSISNLHMIIKEKKITDSIHKLVKSLTDETSSENGVDKDKTKKGVVQNKKGKNKDSFILDVSKL
jgi:hypothetical protein